MLRTSPVERERRATGHATARLFARADAVLGRDLEDRPLTLDVEAARQLLFAPPDEVSGGE
jgi:hypothetical protein